MSKAHFSVIQSKLIVYQIFIGLRVAIIYTYNIVYVRFIMNLFIFLEQGLKNFCLKNLFCQMFANIFFLQFQAYENLYNNNNVSNIKTTIILPNDNWLSKKNYDKLHYCY